jgi:predicted transcriptional regulator
MSENGRLPAEHRDRIQRYREQARRLRDLNRERANLIRALRADGYTANEVAEFLGCSKSTVLCYAPGRLGKVPIAPLREAFLASPATAADIARELGWWDVKRCADSARVKRTLGLLPDFGKPSNGNGRPRSYRTLVDAEIVALIAEAIGVAPWSVMPEDDRPAWARKDEAA